MTFGARSEVALACAPAWFVGVLVTVVVATVLGAAAGSGFDAEVWNFAMLILLVGMLLTIPALLISMFVAFALARWVLAKPLLFGLLSGLSGSAALLSQVSDIRTVVESVLIAVPGIVAAAFAFRYLVTRISAVSPNGDQPSG